jgi:glyoxylase-like metal-dependent hydrolase (beta-lactamase superfamily II)
MRVVIKKKAICLAVFLLALPLLAAQDTPAKHGGTFTLWQLPSQVNTIGNSYVIRTGDGQLIVMDGGVKEETNYLRGFLAANGNQVSCWFISHPHDDHMSALMEILKEPKDIKINQICQSTFSDELIDKEPDYAQSARDYYDTVKQSGIHIIEATEGMELTFGHTTCKILGIKNEELNGYNNSSMIIKVWDPVKSVLFLGDAGAEQGDKLLSGPYRKDLDCDYVQMAHHGQNAVRMDFYRTIKFRACLWPTPSWVYNNDVGNGFNTHILTTIETRNTIDSLKITEQYISFQGLAKIE